MESLKDARTTNDPTVRGRHRTRVAANPSGNPLPAAPDHPTAAIRPVLRSQPVASTSPEEPQQQTSILSPVTAEELAEPPPTSTPEFTLEEEYLLLGFNLFQSPRAPTPPRPNRQPLLAHPEEETDLEMVDLTTPHPAPYPSSDALPTAPLPPGGPRTLMVRHAATQTGRDLVLSLLPTWLQTTIIRRREEHSSSRALRHSAPIASGRTDRQPAQPAPRRAAANPPRKRQVSPA
ncbi:unnamed protein product [Bemisia tabaci]|uniref:Uncharacterized protein n=1 Tax=Bemisia tabaci TaxID=7038 RepID=A0A9P0F357_BEMTA|nr:unnamed protein product [Bemisia tabaci]